MDEAGRGEQRSLTIADVEPMFGSLIAAGYSYDVILSWTWERIIQSASAITAYHAQILNSIATPLLQGLGADVTGTPVERASAADRPDTPPAPSGSAQAPAGGDRAAVAQEAAMLAQLAKFGNVRVSRGGEQSGRLDSMQAAAAVQSALARTEEG